jgi:hypothetical protein
MTTAHQMLHSAGGAPLADFAVAAVTLVAERLEAPLAGAWVVGSVAAGDVRGGASDLDLLFATADVPAAADLSGHGTALADLAEQACPLRGLEAVLYLATALKQPEGALPYLLNVNAGPRMTRRISTRGDPSFWFLLDVAAARDISVPLLGPPARDVIGPVPHVDIVAALEQALAWHAERAGATPDAVLNACRSLHWLRTGRWQTKTAAGEWALDQLGSAVVRDALAARARGSDEALDSAAVAAFLAAVREAVVAGG